MCGEKDITALNANNWQGSPPHVRGKGFERQLFRLYRRITPACAGKRDRRPRPCALRQDYPRVCGEKTCCAASALPSIGSPPHVRGKEMRMITVLNPFGITPAYAGKRPLQPSCGIRG